MNDCIDRHQLHERLLLLLLVLATAVSIRIVIVSFLLHNYLSIGAHRHHHRTLHTRLHITTNVCLWSPVVLFRLTVPRSVGVAQKSCSAIITSNVVPSYYAATTTPAIPLMVPRCTRTLPIAAIPFHAVLNNNNNKIDARHPRTKTKPRPSTGEIV